MKLMDKAGAVELLNLQISAIDHGGTDQVVNLKEQLAQQPNEAELHFDLAIAYNQMALQRNYLIAEKARLELPEEAEELPVLDFSASEPIYRLALQEFEETLRIAPDYYGVQCQMGITYGNLQQFDSAIACYEKALKDDPEDFSAAYYLGITYKDLGNKEQALHYLTMAQQLNPDDEMLQEDLAELQ